MPYFEPFLRKPYIYSESKTLKNFLHSKLINAEYAVLNCDTFNKLSSKSTNSIEYLSEQLNNLTLNFIDTESNKILLRNTSSILIFLDSNKHSNISNNKDLITNYTGLEDNKNLRV